MCKVIPKRGFEIVGIDEGAGAWLDHPPTHHFVIAAISATCFWTVEHDGSPDCRRIAIAKSKCHGQPFFSESTEVPGSARTARWDVFCGVACSVSGLQGAAKKCPGRARAWPERRVGVGASPPRETRMWTCFGSEDSFDMFKVPHKKNGRPFP
jgi:hypothetical protein